jgi:hypothetical protein
VADVVQGERVATAPGSVLVASHEEWLVTRIERSSDGEWFVDVHGLPELVRDTSATFFTGLDDIALRIVWSGGPSELLPITKEES